MVNTRNINIVKLPTVVTRTRTSTHVSIMFFVLLQNSCGRDDRERHTGERKQTTFRSKWPPSF